MSKNTSEETYRLTEEFGGGRSLVEAIVTATAAIQNTEVHRLEPLVYTVDPDALRTVIETSRELQVQFRYSGVEVTVHSAGHVTVEASDSEL